LAIARALSATGRRTRRAHCAPMTHVIEVPRDGGVQRVDGRDVGAAEGLAGPPDPRAASWRAAAEAYVDAHPRPDGRVPDAQRLQILRRLAAGPARTADLLAAMRAVGWVGASDLENRLRELRGTGKRGAGRTVAVLVEVEGDSHRLAEPLPALDEAQMRAVGFAKSIVAQQRSPLAAQALQVLDGVLPGIGIHTGQPGAATMQLAAADMHRFEQARVTRQPIDVTYYSMNSAREATYRLVPVTYVPVGPALKAVCKDVDDAGRPGADRQFALDRIRAVTPTDLAPLAEAEIALRTEVLDVVVTDPLYRIMVQRNQFGVAEADAEQLDMDRWRVRGGFPVALGWDVMEQMSAWAGQVIVYEPLWLVSAVARRLRAGLRAMEEAELELVKPDPDAAHDSLEAALYDPGPPDPGSGPRKLLPRHRPGQRRA
jgi:predicted DNA-binding transcriptional regulator YafY